MNLDPNEQRTGLAGGTEGGLRAVWLFLFCLLLTGLGIADPSSTEHLPTG